MDAKAPGVRKKLQDLEQAAGKTESGVKGIGKASKDTASELSTLGAKMGSFLALIGGSVAISAFVKDTIEANRQLYFLSQNLAMTAQSLFTLGAAGQRIGIGNALQSLAAMFREIPGQLEAGQQPPVIKLLARAGINWLGSPNEMMTGLAKWFSTMPANVALGLGTSYGLSYDQMTFLLQGAKEVSAQLKATAAWSPAGRQTAQAVELKKQLTDLGLQFKKIGYDLLSMVTPALEKFFGLLRSIGAWAQGHEKIVAIVAGVAAALGAFAGIAATVGAVALAWTALTGAIAAAWPVLAVVGIVTALAGAILLLWDDYTVWAEGGNSAFDWTGFEKNVRKAGDAFDWLGDKIGEATGAFEKWLAAHGVKVPENAVGKGLEWYWNHMTLPGLLGIKINPADERGLNAKGNLTGRDIEQYYLNRGYSKEWAAAMAASANSESSGNPKAVGDNGTSFGLFQWHDAARKEAFKKLYGHDISQANAAEQLDFAAIEMKALGIDTSKTVGPRYAASAVTKQFERPKDPMGESANRGDYAVALLNGLKGASSVPAGVATSSNTSNSTTDNSKTTHIGTVNIQGSGAQLPTTPSMARGMDWTTLLTQQNYGLQ